MEPTSDSLLPLGYSLDLITQQPQRGLKASKSTPSNVTHFVSIYDETEARLIEINRFFNSAINEDYKANYRFMVGHSARWIKIAIILGYRIENTGTLAFKHCREYKYIQTHGAIIDLWNRTILALLTPCEKVETPKVIDDIAPKVVYNCITTQGRILKVQARSVIELINHFIPCSIGLSKQETSKMTTMMANMGWYTNDVCRFAIRIREHDQIVIQSQHDRQLFEVVIKQAEKGND